MEDVKKYAELQGVALEKLARSVRLTVSDLRNRIQDRMTEKENDYYIQAIDEISFARDMAKQRRANGNRQGSN